MSLEKMKINLEFSKVQAARFEMEYRVAEFQEKMRELEGQIKIQKAKEDELKSKMDALDFV